MKTIVWKECLELRKIRLLNLKISNVREGYLKGKIKSKLREERIDKIMFLLK